MGFTYMKSIKEVSLESKILKRLENLPDCTKLVNYLFADEELGNAGLCEQCFH